jgi:hypothetical protein
VAEVMRDAARATLACGTARLRTAWSPAPELDEAPFGSVGVVDLGRRLSRREDHSPKLEELDAKVTERFPWLDDEEENGGEPYYQFEQGGTLIHGTRGKWMRHDRPQRSFRDPTLVLDMLATGRVEDGFEKGSEEVRGVACARYGGRLPRSVAADVLDDGPRLHVRGWVDPEGRLVRGSWSSPPMVRPRRLSRREIAPLWRTVEFWDFGLPLDIELPDAEPFDPDDEDLASLFEVAVDLWRMRRDWKRRQRRSG